MPPPKRAPARKPPQPISPYANAPEEVIDPIWLLKGLGITIVAALVCAWLALCLLYYQGEWQLILHPSHLVDRTPASLNLPFEPIRFDAAETGQPRLTAWYLPAAPSARYAGLTVLYLHDGSGSLSATLPALARLHAAGLNVFAFDYRGFGASDLSEHPTAVRMAQDAAAALAYLTDGRHIPRTGIVPYGNGLGASLAVGLAQAHGSLPAVVLDNPDPDPTATAVGTRPSHVVPIRLIFHERFEIAAPLAALVTPKLLLAGGPNPTQAAASLQEMQTLFHQAASPKLSVALPTSPSDAPDPAYQTALIRFLDQYVPTPSAP
jgi:pimeloyl-ACP methyl ester carboxylesterase